MEESGAQDFSAMLDSYEKESRASREEGEIVRGIVVGISDQNVLIDIGYKSEGIVPREEFLDRLGNLTVKRGEEVDVLIKSLEHQDGYALLSHLDAIRALPMSWKRLQLAHQTQETITGRVVGRVKGGLKVDLKVVAAFLPASQIDVRTVHNLGSYINQDIEVRIVELNRKRRNVVVSRRSLLEEKARNVDPASEPARALRVFLCHSSGDKAAVRDLYQRLRANGIAPWLDEEDILPGQLWEPEIRKAVRASDIVIVCLSRGSINKSGFVQKEIRLALDVADEQPESAIFLIPLKFEECEVPERLSHRQWVHLYEENGYRRLMLALHARARALDVHLG